MMFSVFQIFSLVKLDKIPPYQVRQAQSLTFGQATACLWVFLKALTQSFKSGNVKGMPVAALDLNFQNVVAGQYDSNDKTRRYVYAEEVNKFHAVDSSLGRIITDCL